MGLPVKAGFNKIRGLQKTLKAVRNEAGQDVKVMICSESITEVAIVSMLQTGLAGVKYPGDSVFAATCRIAAGEKRAASIREADLAVIVITPKMTNEHVARVAISTANARNRLIVLIDRESDDLQAKKLAKVLGVDVRSIAFLPKLEDAEFAPLLMSKILDSIPDKKIALAAAVPLFRKEVVRRIIKKASNQNAAIGFFVFMPGVDMPLLTMNQVRMILQLSALYGEEVSLKRLYEILGVVASGFIFRALARELIAVIPVIGWFIKGAIAYSGTIAVGRLTVKLLESRSGNELGAKQ
jgi:uncharacterized protein (DUF697 family)